MTGARPSSGDPLLVVVDMQRLFGPGSDWATPGFDELVPRIDLLVGAFGRRVVFTRFLVPAEPVGSWVDYYRAWPFATRPDAGPLMELTAPWTGTDLPRLDRTTFSKWGPELEEMVGPSRTMVVCGVATDCCVIATVLGAVDAGMHVRVVADACAGIDGDAHERAIRVMAGFPPHVRITTLEAEVALRGPAAR